MQLENSEILKRGNLEYQQFLGFISAETTASAGVSVAIAGNADELLLSLSNILVVILKNNVVVIT